MRRKKKGLVSWGSEAEWTVLVWGYKFRLLSRGQSGIGNSILMKIWRLLLCINLLQVEATGKFHVLDKWDFLRVQCRIGKLQVVILYVIHAYNYS